MFWFFLTLSRFFRSICFLLRFNFWLILNLAVACLLTSQFFVLRFRLWYILRKILCSSLYIFDTFWFLRLFAATYLSNHLFLCSCCHIFSNHIFLCYSLSFLTRPDHRFLMSCNCIFLCSSLSFMARSIFRSHLFLVYIFLCFFMFVYHYFRIFFNYLYLCGSDWSGHIWRPRL